VIKDFNPHDTTSFDHEVKLLRSLRHPNIVLFMGVALNDESRFIVTELMHGKSLESLIHNKKHGSKNYLHNSISFQRKVELLLDVVKGMLYLHGLQPTIVHRDLKPSVRYHVS
jgi:serine/threonine protein kinase